MTISLISLVPRKFQSSEILQDYLSVMSDMFQTYFTSVEELTDLVGVETCPDDYLYFLSSLIGTKLTDVDSSDADQRRKEIINTIDWIKLKGTYGILNLVKILTGLDMVIYDMYTNDYVTFIDVEWFVASYQGENPDGLTSDYYKSPHFGLIVNLNVVYEANDDYEYSHLWRPDLFTGVPDLINKMRPVHTVPHFKLLHMCVADESLYPYTMSGPTFWETGTITRIVGSWTYSSLFFDETDTFDDGDYFDLDIESFVASIDNWEISACLTPGTGIDLETSPLPTALTNVVASGSVTKYTITDEKIEWEFEVDKSLVQDHINEIGLYTNGGELMIASTCHDINKDDNTSLKIKVVIYRTSLLPIDCITGYGEGEYGEGEYGTGPEYTE